MREQTWGGGGGGGGGGGVIRIYLGIFPNRLFSK